jgi:hypothetical protein
MEDVTRQQIFTLAAKQLRVEFETLKAVPHKGERGGEAEELIRKFLNDRFPMRFRAAAGFIIDGKDNISKQCDCIVYDALNCPRYRVSDTAPIIPNDNVAVVIEVKSKLDKQQLVSAVDNIEVAKRLAKLRPSTEPKDFLTYETLGILFAFDSAISLEKIHEHYEGLLKERGLNFHLDYIFVLDKGFVSLAMKMPGGTEWCPVVWYTGAKPSKKAEGTHVAVSHIEAGEDTLDRFLCVILSHFAFFRHFVDLPGFDWSKNVSGGQAKLSYLTSITDERNPKAKKLKLQKYAEQVSQEFEKGPSWRNDSLVAKRANSNESGLA